MRHLTIRAHPHRLPKCFFMQIMVSALLILSGCAAQPETQEQEARIEQVVVIGASIVQQAFGQNLRKPHREATLALQNEGLDIKVYGYGWGGFEISEIGEKVEEAFDRFQSHTLFIIHIGGNNVSRLRPYENAEPDDLNAMMNDAKALSMLVEPRRDSVVFATLTYRSYPEMGPYTITADVEHLGSKPFIVDILQKEWGAATTPLCQEKGDVMDFYSWSQLNFEHFISNDGIHLSERGKTGLREYLASQLDVLITSDC